MECLPRPTKSAKTASSVPMSSLTDMSNVALRHTFRFADARTLAAAECLKPRLAQVARAAVVEAADKRHGVRLEAVPGCAWRLLVQEGLAGPGCVALAVHERSSCAVRRDRRTGSELGIQRLRTIGSWTVG